MAKKGTNPRPTKLPLPAGAPGLVPEPAHGASSPPNSSITLSTQQQPLDISGMLILTVRSQVPHRHGAPHFNGHDWLLQNAYATARTQTA